MHVGGRNRVMHWTGTAIPYKPGKNDLLEATRRVGAVIGDGGIVAIAGEGRIHAGERDLLPLSEGARVLRAAVGRAARADRHQRHELAALRRSCARQGRGAAPDIRTPDPRGDRAPRRTRSPTALQTMVADAPDVPVPGRVGRWLTEQFNDWPEGSRAAARPLQPLRDGSGRRRAAPRRGRRDRHLRRAIGPGTGGRGVRSGILRGVERGRRRDRGSHRAVERSEGISGPSWRAGRRPDRRLGRGAAARRRDPAGHRQGRRRLPQDDRTRRGWFRTGVRFGRRTAGGHRPRPGGPSRRPGRRPCTPSCRVCARRSPTPGTASSPTSWPTSARPSSSEPSGPPTPPRP